MNNYTNKKLTMNVKLLYTMEELNTLPIGNMFYKIDGVSLEKTPLGNMAKVEGKKVFIGYTLDDGTFYDVRNNIYIPVSDIKNNNGVIEDYIINETRILKQN